jgi:hypothetical protein
MIELFGKKAQNCAFFRVMPDSFSALAADIKERRSAFFKKTSSQPREEVFGAS